MAIDKREMAANYGWSYAFLKSNKELWRLFNKAVKKNYAPQRFVAELRNTKWFKKHGESWRKSQLLKKTDPSTYKERWWSLRAEVRDQGVQIGADLSGDVLSSITNTALWMGWNQSQIRNALADYVDEFGKSAHFGGEAGSNEDELRTYAYQMGVRFSQGTLKRWLQSIAHQNQTVEDYKAEIQRWAENSWPGFKDQIRQGMTVAEIAQPYTQSAAALLEIAPTEFDLFNPMIRKALQFRKGSKRDDSGGEDSEAMPLWEFERMVRKDPRWLGTDNARESMMTTSRQILSDFGMVF